MRSSPDTLSILLLLWQEPIKMANTALVMATLHLNTVILQALQFYTIANSYSSF
jgi:hypothetical protein